MTSKTSIQIGYTTNDVILKHHRNDVKGELILSHITE